MSTPKITLRNVKDADGRRLLEAFMTPEGDLVIEGWDFGDGVERALGVREYEWTWTIRAPHVPLLLRALEKEGDVLAALSHRFSGGKAAELGTFLESHPIPHERWSRSGD